MEQRIEPLPLRVEGERVYLLDQRLLPAHVRLYEATSLEDICSAIEGLVIQGAPTLGIAAAFALALEAKKLAIDSANNTLLLLSLDIARQRLQKTRPTAINIKWTTDLLFQEAAQAVEENELIHPLDLAKQMFDLSSDLLAKQRETNISLSSFGAALIKDGAAILTHGNAGSLATCGWGTALGIIRSAHWQGVKLKVYVDETRPRNQGMLTMWELAQEQINSTLVCDSAAGYLMSQRKINMVIVGADRIALNGDTANSIGTYSLASLASTHGIPFYVAASTTSFDPNIAEGRSIKIEEGDAQEITASVESLLPDTSVLNLPLDLTPGNLITAFITERGLFYPTLSLPKALAQPATMTRY